MKYQIGQMVITHAFETSACTYYIPEMSQWDGKEGIITKVWEDRLLDGRLPYLVHDWWWPEEALSPVEEPSSEWDSEPLLGVTSKMEPPPAPDTESRDLRKILRVGDKIYSTMQGDVEVGSIELEDTFCIRCVDKSMITYYYSLNGRYLDTAGECLLFPSRDNHDWSTFKRRPDMKKGDIVKVWDNTKDLPVIRVFSHFAPLGDIRTYNYADGTQLWQHAEKISVDELKDFE